MRDVLTPALISKDIRRKHVSQYLDQHLHQTTSPRSHPAMKQREFNNVACGRASAALMQKQLNESDTTIYTRKR